jgi:tetratricopeptide (TPR) repeat protein
MKTTRAALIAALITSGASLVAVAAPAAAQNAPAQGQAAQPEREYDLRRAERTALAPALTAIGASDWAAAQAALPAAQAAAESPDAKYLVGQIMLRIGIGTENVQLQSQAVDALIDSGGAQANELPRLLENQLRFATQAGDNAKAERAMARLAELNPNDPNVIMRAADLRMRNEDFAGALQQYRRAMEVQQAAGQTVSEDLRKRVLAIAYRQRLPESLALARELVTAYPNPTNWRDALVIYRELGGVEQPMHLDFYRLMSAAQALTSERDYIEYAEAAERGAMFGEVKSTLEQGLARNAITGNATYARQMLTSAERRIAEDRQSLPAERTRALAGSNGDAILRLGDAYYGYGEYAQAAELYRAALQKGGVDANVLNTRLGAALARAGQAAEAEAAFQAVTGPRAELATFWRLWLSRRA